MRALEVKLPPVIPAIVIGFAMWWMAQRLPAVQLSEPLRLALAVALALCGILVALLGVREFRQARTTLNPIHPEGASSVVTGGVYGYTRNPMYAGLTAALLGWAVWLSVPWVLLGPVALMLFLTRFQIIPEERAMKAKFGRDYDEYSKRVHRWL